VIKLIAIVALLASSTAFATNPVDPPKPVDPSSTSTASLEAQIKVLQNQIATANARANAAAVAGAQSASQSGAQANGNGGNSDVTVDGDQNSYRAKSLALALPGLVAAPAVPGQCLEHLRGGGALSAGVTGRTRLNEECLKRVQCLAIADRYASWGFYDSAAKQLETCGGVNVEITVTDRTPVEPDANCVSKETVDKMFRSCVSK
jgi:hypothetical protein